jgi:hypothetical protein
MSTDTPPALRKGDFAAVTTGYRTDVVIIESNLDELEDQQRILRQSGYPDYDAVATVSTAVPSWGRTTHPVLLKRLQPVVFDPHRIAIEYLDWIRRGKSASDSFNLAVSDLHSFLPSDVRDASEIVSARLDELKREVIRIAHPNR